MIDPQLEQRALEYARLSGIRLDLKTPLGDGTDGAVWKSDKKSAVKVLNRERNYGIELECYQRFKHHKISSIHGFAVPQLLGFNDDLRVIELRIVTPPYILDFAKAWLDMPPDFSEETMADWETEGEELFGADRWTQVTVVLWGLRALGIYYYDAKPQNIRFADDAD